MINFKPFKAVIPNHDKAKDVAALPYDVFNREEAKIEVNHKPYSFLRIDRAETNFTEDIDIYTEKVYQKASSLLNDWTDQKILIQDGLESFYLYELSTPDHKQTGIVGLTTVNDLINGSIKDHELTRRDKQIDRINHIDYCNAHTGPILMFYKDKLNFSSIIESIKDKSDPIIDFVSDDSIRHRVFKVMGKSDQNVIIHHFNTLNSLYIADGHHRAAAAKAIALKRNYQDVTDLSKSSNLFLSVVFPETQLKILDYNRVIKDLNQYNTTEFINEVEKSFEIIRSSSDVITPEQKGYFSMYLADTWFLLKYKFRDQLLDSPIDLLDVSILQNYLFNPILGIKDPIVDSRID
jgi:uncharacterized protein (DUF1015 family)